MCVEQRENRVDSEEPHHVRGREMIGASGVSAVCSAKGTVMVQGPHGMSQ